MMTKLLFKLLNIYALGIVLFINSKAFSQDERDMRDILLGPQLSSKSFSSELSNVVHFHRLTERHFIDLDGDAKKESFMIEGKDSSFYFHLFNYEGKKIFEQKFDSVGPNAYLSKVGIKQLSKETKILILYFFEGALSYIDQEVSTRAYFVTFETKNLRETIKGYKGPLLYTEIQKPQKIYQKRHAELAFKDLDGNGTLEILVQNYPVSRVYKYLGEGNWFKF